MSGRSYPDTYDEDWLPSIRISAPMTGAPKSIVEAAADAQAFAASGSSPPAEIGSSSPEARPRSEQEKGRPSRRRVDDPRTVIIRYRATPGERDATVAAASKDGMSLGAFVRERTIGAAGSRAGRKPGPDVKLLAQALAQLGKPGSNLNQIARRLNSDQLVQIPELAEVIAEHRACVAALMRALGVYSSDADHH